MTMEEEMDAEDRRALDDPKTVAQVIQNLRELREKLARADDLEHVGSLCVALQALIMQQERLQRAA